ncbi:hypothetical protein FK529_04920 [Tsukamurella asaccharolytica]|uniref:Uncharacterized protein n=1 Tax=Tsukamurella asaccharolytica TaxID=2592067 RepID=A0A5C5RF19_9ACTN|nr:hypothetical protein [Tsukamurella asaccharolytica]TWS20685.1 hypothetical protein FK529_04920 [Tsukamurella asaccharolytica]
MSDHLSSSAPHALVPVTEAAALLGGSPALYIALLAGGLVEGELRDGVWHVDTDVLAAALAVRERTSLPSPVTCATCTDVAQGHPDPTVDGAA